MNDKAAGYLSSCVQRRSEMNNFVWPAVIKMKAGLEGHYGDSVRIFCQAVSRRQFADF
jgi:hypothetical protein